MHIFEWVLGWIGQGDGPPIFTRIGKLVRSNDRRPVVRTTSTRCVVRTFDNRPLVRTFNSRD